MSPIFVDPPTQDGEFLASVDAPTSVLVVGLHNVFEYNGLTINSRSELETYMLDDLQGFEDADLRLSDQENPQEDGFTVGPGLYGARVMSMSGKIHAGSYTRLLDMQRELENAFLDLVERPLVIKPLVGGYFEQPDVQIYCRKADKIMLSKKLETIDIQGMVRRAFTITLKATDPTYRSTELYTGEMVPTIVNTLGRSYDRDYDLAYDSYMDENYDPVAGGGAANLITVVNQGDWPALPIIRFHGYMDGVRLTNTTNGHHIILTQPIFSGDYLEIDVYTGEVIDSSGVNRSDYVDTTSDWMRLVGDRGSYDGQNVLTISATNLDDSARVEIFHQDTWIGG